MSSEAEPVVKCDDCRKRSRDDTETADTEVIVARTLYAGYTQRHVHRHADNQKLCDCRRSMRHARSVIETLLTAAQPYDQIVQ